MHVPAGEYEGYCNHPLNKYVDDVGSVGDNYRNYHPETEYIPLTCPLRNVDSIDIGIKMKVSLNKDLLIENKGKYQLK